MTSLVEKALESRRMIFQGAVIATLVALGVNLISSWLSLYFENFRILILLVGLLFIIIGFSYFVKQLLRERKRTLNIDGVILLDPEKKCVVEAKGYGFSEKLSTTLSAAFVENEALKVSWEREMFPAVPEQDEISEEDNDEAETSDDIGYFSIVKMNVDDGDDAGADKKILLEAIEFCFLEFLSNHLSEYFDAREHDAREVHVIERHSIPHMVLTNRILSLLTTPIEDRQIFIKSGINKNPPRNGEIHAIYASNGAVYEKFHLALPVNTTISRPAPGEIVLDHPRFQMALKVHFYGFTENLPTYFSKYYISDAIDDLDAKDVRISVTAELHPLSFLRLNGWEYYQWIDSFFEYLVERSSFDSFLERISWQSIATSIRAEIIGRRRGNRENKKENMS